MFGTREKYTAIVPLLFQTAMLLVVLLGAACQSKKTLFRQLTDEQSGITFSNTITETEEINPVNYEYIYNGGGVGIGDFNGDGLQDMYFTGNMVANELYLNRGKLKFENVTQAAGVEGKDKWCKGVSVVDINNDGLQDMYVCAAVKYGAERRKNILYINQGINKTTGIPRFADKAAEYGLDDTTSTQAAAFFDYDNDGDLDVYLLVNDLTAEYPNTYRPLHSDGSYPNTDRLYENTWSDSLKHPVYKNVSGKAGIKWEGFGLGLNICDINNDGWKDIYVSNDYVSPNILYINNQDGTFTNRINEYFKHSSTNAMGNDVVDINNDGLPDVIELDMSPEDNYRKKMMLKHNSYQTYQQSEQYGIMFQYVRNSLQINMGPRPQEAAGPGAPVFAECSFMAGIDATDWSWTPSVADFDNDGYRDIIITNGFPKDITDNDFISYRKQAFKKTALQELLKQIPAVKIPNYCFKNKGDIQFQNVTGEWGMDIPSFSNGAVYADLDNDGDLDYVVNNINEKAFLFENKADVFNPEKQHYLRIKFKGTDNNSGGLGATIRLYYASGKQMLYEHSPYRGYLSSVEPVAHFGLGTTGQVDSVVITWPGGKVQTLAAIAADQEITVDIKNATSKKAPSETFLKPLFSIITQQSGITYKSTEADFIDFNIQKLLPHKFSQYGPALAAGDVNGDGLEDLVVGGGFPEPTQLFLQNKNSGFVQRQLLPDAKPDDKQQDDAGLLLFDADGDKDLDLFVASGGMESKTGSESYADKFYVNDGKANFTLDTEAFPKSYISKSCVKAADFDGDGDMDLFLGGRLKPGFYPQPVNSFILRNDSKPGHIKFIDVTAQIAPALQGAGLICDALWTDFDNDGMLDLITAGEWMPITFYKNVRGKFIAQKNALSNETGWWNSLTAGDFDNDGDMDYIAGNLGLNSFYRTSSKQPVSIYAKDFDENGSYDAIPTLFLPGRIGGAKKEFPAHGRDDLIKEITPMKGKFTDYGSYAKATLDKVLYAESDLKNSLTLTATNFHSCFIQNLGAGNFKLQPLPREAQVAPVYGMVADDFDFDGNLDLLVNGNDFGIDPSTGKYDALNGLLLKGNGKGNFLALPPFRSGTFIPGDGKALLKLRSADGGYLITASQNKGSLELFRLNTVLKLATPLPGETSAVVFYANGKKRKEEFLQGSSFFSQSANFIPVTKTMNQIQFFKYGQNTRTLSLN